MVAEQHLGGQTSWSRAGVWSMWVAIVAYLVRSDPQRPLAALSCRFG